MFLLDDDLSGHKPTCDSNSLLIRKYLVSKASIDSLWWLKRNFSITRLQRKVSVSAAHFVFPWNIDTLYWQRSVIRYMLNPDLNRIANRIDIPYS